MNFRFQLLSLLSLGLIFSFCSNTEPQHTLPAHPDDISISEAQVFVAKKGNVEINGTIEDDAFNDQYVYLFETEGREYFLIDSAMVKSQIFTFSRSFQTAGLFKIGLKNHQDKLGQVIINPSEKTVSFTYRNENFAYGLEETNSAENNALKEYTKAERSYLREVRSIRNGRMESQAKKAALFRLDETFKAEQDAMAAKHAGTFFANMVSHLQSPARFDMDNYWDDIDFQDKSLIHSMVFPARIEDYMRIHASKGGTDQVPLLGFYNAVDLIANKIKDNGDDDVLSFVLYTMSEGFYSSNMEALSLYVIDNYFFGDGCGDADIDEIIKARASGIRSLQVGQSPPDFTLKNSEGNSITLSQIVRQNEYTLIMFWASFCHKCEMEIPSLKPVYTKYKNQGFEIVGLSVDQDKNEWIKAIERHDIDWLNLSDLKGWKGKAAKDYRVSSTPIFFILDENQTIIARPKSVQKIAQTLRKLLE